MTVHTPIIAPSILAADLSKLGDEITDLSRAGADWLHIDVMDGQFVPPITFGDNLVSTAKKTAPALFRDVHLMIVEPENHLKTFADAGASRISIHCEASVHLHRTLGQIAALGCKVGVAINPGTPIDTIFDVLELCDLVVIMSVNPGWGGQTFIPRSLKRIEALKSEIVRQGLSVLIEVDGGVNQETARQCLAAGADVLVAGTAILGKSDRNSAIQALRTC